MSDVQRSGWADNPFTFSIAHDITPPEPQPFEISNFLKDFFEKLKTKYVQVPPSHIDSEEDIGSEAWRPEHGMSGARLDTFAPDPGFLGIPQKRKTLITQKGIKGWNTHYNIMGDQSSSMSLPATEFEGKSCDRTIVLRLAASCLIKQASFNMDSFTVYSYNDSGKVLWPIPNGEPAYNYEDCIAWLTAESISKVWNIVENNRGTSTQAWSDGSENNMLNCLAPYVPDGSNNEKSAFDVMIQNCQKHDISGMITVFLTDGDSLPASIIDSNRELTGSLTYDAWLRQFGHVFYIILRNKDEQRKIDMNVEKIASHLMRLYGWNHEEASKFIWGFPDSNMKDSADNPITDVADQMAWLFAEIGRIGAGLSEEFNDLASPPDEDED